MHDKKKIHSYEIKNYLCINNICIYEKSNSYNLQKKKKVSKMSTTIRCIRTGIYVLQEVNKTPGRTINIHLLHSHIKMNTVDLF